MSRAVACIVAVSILATVSGCAGVSNDELSRRVQAAKPSWQSYVEDLKGQLGAGPTAEWEGTPVRARKDDKSLQISFRLSGRWSELRFGIPVLVREPRGTVCMSSEISKDGALAVYKVELPQSAAELPWVELKYPTGMVRMVFAPDGSWSSGE